MISVVKEEIEEVYVSGNDGGEMVWKMENPDTLLPKSYITLLSE